MSKNNILVILGTGVVIAIIIIVANFNIEVNVNNKGDSQQASQIVQGSQDDSMASHHGEDAPVDDTVFNNLVGKNAPDFTLESYDDKKITLSSLKGKNVILFFNEGLMC